MSIPPKRSHENTDNQARKIRIILARRSRQGQTSAQRENLFSRVALRLSSRSSSSATDRMPPPTVTTAQALNDNASQRSENIPDQTANVRPNFEAPVASGFGARPPPHADRNSEVSRFSVNTDMVSAMASMDLSTESSEANQEINTNAVPPLSEPPITAASDVNGGAPGFNWPPDIPGRHLISTLVQMHRHHQEISSRLSLAGKHCSHLERASVALQDAQNALRTFRGLGNGGIFQTCVSTYDAANELLENTRLTRAQLCLEEEALKTEARKVAIDLKAIIAAVDEYTSNVIQNNVASDGVLGRLFFWMWRVLEQDDLHQVEQAN